MRIIIFVGRSKAFRPPRGPHYTQKMLKNKPLRMVEGAPLKRPVCQDDDLLV
jgi:hypothetical protein